MNDTQREEIADILRKGYHGIAETKVINSLAALVARREALARTGVEHYYSHAGDDGTINHRRIYYCVCGKSDNDRDRLLRHIAWQEKRLAALTTEATQGEKEER